MRNAKEQRGKVGVGERPHVSGLLGAYSKEGYQGSAHRNTSRGEGAPADRNLQVEEQKKKPSGRESWFGWWPSWAKTGGERDLNWAGEPGVRHRRKKGETLEGKRLISVKRPVQRGRLSRSRELTKKAKGITRKK